MEKRTSIIFHIVLFIVCLIAVFSLGRCTNSNNGTEVVIENKTDTLYSHSIDTVYVPKTEIKYKYVNTIDTLYVKDTILLVEEKIYEDSLSTIHFHGINADIDSISYYIPMDTVFVNKETTITKIQKKGFGQFIGVGIGAGVGVGYNPIDKTLNVGAPQVGIHVVYGFGYHF